MHTYKDNGHSTTGTNHSNRISTTNTAIQTSEGDKQRKENKARTPFERLEVGRMDPLVMLNLIQLTPNPSRSKSQANKELKKV